MLQDKSHLEAKESQPIQLMKCNIENNINLLCYDKVVKKNKYSKMREKDYESGHKQMKTVNYFLFYARYGVDPVV